MNWGRIFFLYEADGTLSAVKGQPLENHVENTRLILTQFQPSYFHEATRSRLFTAAARHDEGKKQTFRIIDQREREKKWGKREGDKRFSYSFAGHRFRVPGKDAYIDGLIRSHHEFSVEQINREKSGLSGQERLHFVDDLYLLCMADQLEAELAVKVVEDHHGDIPRTFMEFVSRRVDGLPHTFTVVPWPFAPEVFRIPLLLKRPLMEDLARATARRLQEAFEKDNRFETETVTITLRRQ